MDVEVDRIDLLQSIGYLMDLQWRLEKEGADIAKDRDGPGEIASRFTEAMKVADEAPAR